MFKYPMNHPNLLTLMSQPETASIPVNVKEPFLEFSRLVHQCAYLSEQYFPRFQSLSQNKELVHYICDVIETMECIFGEDIKAFGYSLVLLAYSQDERAERLLAKINEQAIQEKCTLNHVLLSVFKNVDSKEIGVLYKAQRDFHDTLIQEQLLHSGYFQFADAVGHMDRIQPMLQFMSIFLADTIPINHAAHGMIFKHHGIPPSASSVGFRF